MPSYFQTICEPAIRLISSFWTRFWRNTLMAHRYQPPVVIFRSSLNNHYECFLTLNVSVITSWHFVPSYLWYLVFGGAPFDFNCASAPRRRNFDLQSYSFRETFLINVLVGRHPRVFRLKHFEKFLGHHQSWQCCKIHFFAVAIFWKVFLYLTLLITVDKPMTKCTRVEHPSYHLDELRSIRMNMKSNTGYVPTKPGDLPSEALA